MTPPDAFAGYTPLASAFDELFSAPGLPRPAFERVAASLKAESAADFEHRQALAEAILLQEGVTFSVYADQRGTEKILPFDVLPRMIAAAEWAALERGLKQRITALEQFLHDVYGPQHILNDGTVPRDLVLGAKHYLPQVQGISPTGGVRIHISGIDLIRDAEGIWRVLEDNLRTPSGVSYVLENRLVTKRVFARSFAEAKVSRVDSYPTKLAEMLRSVAPAGVDDPRVVVLTPGRFNSAYFEHGFLARTTGAPLVEPGDLFVGAGDRVFVRTVRGPMPVDVIYRRIDEAFLDPEVFRPDSMLGVPGLMRAWSRGTVTLVNAPGNGVADDKAVYAYVPDMIRYYLGEEPLLAQVPTYRCDRDEDRAYVLDHLEDLVVKAVDEAGGYGMLMGPQSTAEERATFARQIQQTPRRYIAQPRIELSTCPTWDHEAGAFMPRRVDLRPYILSGRDGPWVLPGGLTRVALVPGSYVVNSSQGGGSKDTWVLKA
ncbi:MAG: circularly permuted type 2 ATP-grasp protein [bacterium]